MLKEYSQLLILVGNKLKTIGFSLAEDNDFSATFSHQSDRSVVFEGDKYVRPTYTIWVEVEKQSGKKFALWLFIKAFEKNHGMKEETYSLDGELDWLIKNKDDVFLNYCQYENEYQVLDSI